MSFFYPELDTSTLKNVEIVRQLVQKHPSYFLESPYGSEAETLLTKWFKRARSDTDGGVEAERSFDGLIAELEFIFSDLKTARPPDSSEEKIAYIKTSTLVLERIVGLQERAFNVKQVSDFQRAVMQIMDEVMTPTQRTVIMDKMAAFAGVAEAKL